MCARGSAVIDAPWQHWGRVLAAALALLISSASSASAAIIAVDSTADDAIANANCTLREAVIAANTDAVVDACTAGSGADVITVPAGTILLTVAGAGEDAGATGDLDVTADVEIQGAGAGSTIIDGNVSDRVFDIDPSAAGINVRISGVTLRHGGMVSEGGGIRNGGSLTLSDSSVEANSADGLLAKGGGVRSSGTLTLMRTTVADNTAQALSMGFDTPSAQGGGIFSDGTTAITAATMNGNTVAAGTGASFGALAEGGAISSSGQLSVTASVVSANRATNVAGASANGGGIASSGTLALINTTVSDNRTESMVNPPSDAGGGLFLYDTATTTVSNCTIVGNSAFQAGAFANDGAATLRNTIVADNGFFNCATGFFPGTTTSDSYNLDSDGSCGFSGSDLIGVEPLLGPLQDNGGPTFTRALLSGSSAIDAGSPAIPGSGGGACEATDQRGTPRPRGVRCDIGSFESTPCPTAPRAGCATPGKSVLLIQDRDADGAGPKDKLLWKWLKGPLAAQSAFGDPTASADYVLCVYAEAAQALAMQAFAPPAGTCGAAPCWKALGTKGYRRVDPDAGADGLSRIILKAGGTSTKVIVKGTGTHLDLSPGSLPLDSTAAVIVQLGDSDNGNCWESLFPPGSVQTNSDTEFRAKEP